MKYIINELHDVKTTTIHSPVDANMDGHIARVQGYKQDRHKWIINDKHVERGKKRQ